MLQKKISISVVESCTGGLLSSYITSFPGISKIYNMGLITYSNKSKKLLLKIKEKDINKNGVVSKKIAKLMVESLQKISKSKICISTTGVAGPLGGKKNKPIGLVFIGIIYNNKIFIIEKKFKGSRTQIQEKTVRTIFKKLEKLI